MLMKINTEKLDFWQFKKKLAYEKFWK